MKQYRNLSAGLVAVALVSGLDASASSTRPNSEFAFSLPTVDAKEAIDAVAAALQPLGFKLTNQAVGLEAGLIGVEFWKPETASVQLSGSAACIRVAIHTSHTLKPGEQTMYEAAELNTYLRDSLRTRDGVQFFKSSREYRRCEEAF
jgi:hypothetical protein